MNDFEDAAFRHFESASLLTQSGHIANASHLFGFSAECVLKALIFQRLLNITVPQATKKHIGGSLWNHFSAHPVLASFPLRIARANAYRHHFSQWQVDQRYWGRTQFSAQISTASIQTLGAKGLLGVLDLVRRGLL
jgi:hypothetical protein